MKKAALESFTITAQASGYKNLKIEGGFRLQLDIFEANDRDVAMVALLVNKRKLLKVTIEEVEESKK
jgi:hypothetical protein